MYFYGFYVLAIRTVGLFLQLIYQRDAFECCCRWRFNLIFKLKDLVHKWQLYITTLSEWLLLFEESIRLSVAMDTSFISGNAGSGSTGGEAGNVLCISRTCACNCSASLTVTSQKAHCMKQDSRLFKAEVSIVCIDFNLMASSSSCSKRIRNTFTINYIYNVTILIDLPLICQFKCADNCWRFISVKCTIK